MDGHTSKFSTIPDIPRSHQLHILTMWKGGSTLRYFALPKGFSARLSKGRPQVDFLTPSPVDQSVLYKTAPEIVEPITSKPLGKVIIYILSLHHPSPHHSTKPSPPHPVPCDAPTSPGSWLAGRQPYPGRSGPVRVRRPARDPLLRWYGHAQEVPGTCASRIMASYDKLSRKAHNVTK